MDCNTCGAKKPEPVSFQTHESDMARLERTIKRFWILLIIMLALLVGSNIAWLIYESQFEDVMITAEQEADDGSNNYAVGGDYYYGGKAEGNN